MLSSQVVFEIPGKPFAKQRPRASRFGVHNTKANESYERVVGQIAMNHFTKPMEGAVSITILATFEPPKSWSKKKVRERLNRPHMQRPDLDNCMKAILDGLNRIAFADDSQVAEITCRKMWGPTAKTVVFRRRM